jgi:hypothetical protein
VILSAENMVLFVTDPSPHSTVKDEIMFEITIGRGPMIVGADEGIANVNVKDCAMY